MINERYLVELNQKMEYISNVLNELLRVNSEINTNIIRLNNSLNIKKQKKTKKKK